MTIFFLVLIVLASVILGLIVLVQNPKGGGLAGNIAGISNQFMGVKQTTDVLERGTWIFGGLIAVLCLVSVIFMPKTDKGGLDNRLNQTETTAPAPKPPTSQPAPAPTSTPAPGGK